MRPLHAVLRFACRFSRGGGSWRYSSGTSLSNRVSTARTSLPCARPVRFDTRKMWGVHGNGRLAEPGVEHHVGGLAADAGQGYERFAGARHLAFVQVEQIGRAHVGTPVTNAHIVCRLLLEKKNHLSPGPHVYDART